MLLSQNEVHFIIQLIPDVFLKFELKIAYELTVHEQYLKKFSFLFSDERSSASSFKYLS